MAPSWVSMPVAVTAKVSRPDHQHVQEHHVRCCLSCRAVMETSRPLIRHAVFVEFCGAFAAAWEVQMAQLLVP
jgi:hypothetical protein